MSEIDTGLAFFSVIGFIIFVWGGAWLGFKIDESAQTERARRKIVDGKRRTDEIKALQMGDSLGALIGGGLALIIALVIRYYI